MRQTGASAGHGAQRGVIVTQDNRLHPLAGLKQGSQLAEQTGQQHAVTAIRSDTQVVGVTHPVHVAINPDAPAPHVVHRLNARRGVPRFRHPHIRLFTGHPRAQKIVGTPFEIQRYGALLWGILQQRQNAGIVARLGAADAMAHGNASATVRNTSGRRPRQCCRISILMLPSIMPRRRHWSR